MSAKKSLHLLLSPGPSLDTEDDDQDEDFVASDQEGSHSGGDDDSDGDGSGSASEGASEGEDEDAAAAGTPDLPFRAELLRALQEDEGPMPEEDILSDSDIAGHSSDEEGDLRRALLSSDDEATDDEAAPAAAADDDPPPRPPAGSAPPALGPLSPPRPARAPSLPQLADLGSPLLEAFGAVLGPLESGPPIAQRTRAHVSLLDVSIEDLEAALAAVAGDEEVLRLGVDDEEEYERFLASLRGGGGAAPGAAAAAGAATDGEGDDSDDEDFVLELEKMLGDAGEAGGAAAGGEGAGAGRRLRPRRRRAGPRPPRKPRRSLRLLPKGAARPLYAARLAAESRERMLAPLVALSAALTGGPPAGGDGTTLAELAALAMATDASHSLAVEVIPSAPAHVPLPSEPLSAAAAAARAVVWAPPLPAVMRRYQLPPPPEGAPVVAANFQPLQYALLHTLIHQHVQLLAQTHALALAAGNAGAGAASGSMLLELEQFARVQGQAREGAGIPPYVPACLGIVEPAERAGLAALEAQLAALQGGPQGVPLWAPQSGRPVFTVADVAPLRLVPLLVAAMPPPIQVPPEGAAAAAAAAQEAAAAQTQAQAQAALAAGGQPPPKKKRRRGKLPTEHEAWACLPDSVALALAPARRHFDPAMEPHPPAFLPTAQMLFTPAEDQLLAWGIRKHLYDWTRIRNELLPCKTEKQLFVRKKNRSAGNAPDNPVKQVVWGITMPLTPAEVALLEKATEYYGNRQPRRWEAIAKEHLRHRNPTVLAMLWAEHVRGGQGGAGGGAGAPGRRAAPAAGAAAPAPAALQSAFLQDGDASLDGSSAQVEAQTAPAAGRPPAPPAAEAVPGELTLRSPPRDVASELQRLLSGSPRVGSPGGGPPGSASQRARRELALRSPVLQPTAAAARRARVASRARAQPRSASRQRQRPASAMEGDSSAAAGSAAAPRAGSRAASRLAAAAATGRELELLQGTLMAAARPDHEIEREELPDSDHEDGGPSPHHQGAAPAAAPPADAAAAATALESGHASALPSRRAHVPSTVGRTFEVEELGDSDDDGAPAPAPLAERPQPVVKEQRRQQHQQEEPAPWAPEQDKQLLKAALAAGGMLAEGAAAELSLLLDRPRGAVEARCALLVGRFREKVRQRQQQREATNQ